MLGTLFNLISLVVGTFTFLILLLAIYVILFDMDNYCHSAGGVLDTRKHVIKRNRKSGTETFVYHQNQIVITQKLKVVVVGVVKQY